MTERMDRELGDVRCEKAKRVVVAPLLELRHLLLLSWEAFVVVIDGTY